MDFYVHMNGVHTRDGHLRNGHVRDVHTSEVHTREVQNRSDETFRVTALVSLSRVNHRFGPKAFDHGTLFFVREGSIYIEVLEAGLGTTVHRNHFIWLPPGLVRSTRTDERGAEMHALLLERVDDRDHLLPCLQLPERPVISAARNPAHVAALFDSAEQRWANAGHARHRVTAYGFAHLILAQWLASFETRDVSPHMEKVVQQVIQYIAANCHRPDLDVDELRALTPWSRRYFFQAFHHVTGLTPQGYVRQVRLNRALSLLRIGELKVGDVARRCGFRDAAYFSRIFTRAVGRPPSDFRSG